MAYAAPPMSGYSPLPPDRPQSHFRAQSYVPNQSPDALATTMAGMTISSTPAPPQNNQHTNPPASALPYQSAQYQTTSSPMHNAHSPQYLIQHYEPGSLLPRKSGFSAGAPPVPAASTRPVHQNYSPAPASRPLAQPQYSPTGYHSAQHLYQPVQSSAFPSQSITADSVTAPSQYTASFCPQSQPGTPVPPQGQRPVGIQPPMQVQDEAVPATSATSYKYPSQPQYLNNSPHLTESSAQQPQPYNPHPSTSRPMSYAGPSGPGQVPPSQTYTQQLGKKNRGFLSSTGKIGVGLVGGLVTAMSINDGKENLEKWGKGKMNSFAGAMGYAPVASHGPSSVAPHQGVGRPPSGNHMHKPLGAHLVQPEAYCGPGVLGPRPVRDRLHGTGGPPHVATAMLSGAVSGGIGGGVGASLVGGSNTSYSVPTTATTTDGSMVNEQTTIVDTSYTNISSLDNSSAGANTVGLQSTVTCNQTNIVDASYSNIGYQGTGDSVVYTDSNVYSNDTGTTYADTTIAYIDTSGSLYTGQTGTYANSSAYGQTDMYTEATATEVSYAADTSYGSYGGYGGETPYAAETETYVDVESVAEAATSAGGGVSWMDSLGLSSSSWTGMSSSGGSLDDGSAALALI